MSLYTVSAPLSSLTGVIERITFHSEESGYTVARLNTGNIKQLTTMGAIGKSWFRLGRSLKSWKTVKFEV